MNLRQIEVFRNVMQTGSIKDAASLMHVSSPAVSKLLGAAERAARADRCSASRASVGGPMPFNRTTGGHSAEQLHG